MAGLLEFHIQMPKKYGVLGMLMLLSLAMAGNATCAANASQCTAGGSLLQKSARQSLESVQEENDAIPVRSTMGGSNQDESMKPKDTEATTFFCQQGASQSGHNQLGGFVGKTRAWCENKCTKKTTCMSYDTSNDGGNECYLSTTKASTNGGNGGALQSGKGYTYCEKADESTTLKADESTTLQADESTTLQATTEPPEEPGTTAAPPTKPPATTEPPEEPGTTATPRTKAPAQSGRRRRRQRTRRRKAAREPARLPARQPARQ